MLIRLVLITIPLLVFAHATVIDEPQPSLPNTTPAPQPVAHVQQKSFVLHDAKRDKDLPIRVVYPDQFEGDAPAPTIIFSHGAGGSGEYYNPLAYEWASHGYIVILPTHSDSLSLKRENGERPFLNQRKRGKQGTEGLFDFSDWMNRPRDISFVIDSVGLIEKQVPAIAGRVDMDRIGVGGHSFGAFTAQLIGGADPIGQEVFRDPRSRCELLISPQGVGEVLTEHSWDHFVGPALTISGDNDEGRNGQPPVPYRRDPYDHSPPDTHTLLWIDGAYHNFGGITGRVIPLPGMGPANPAQVELVKRATLAFWDHHLRDESDDTDAFADELRELLKGEAVSIENN